MNQIDNFRKVLGLPTSDGATEAVTSVTDIKEDPLKTVSRKNKTIVVHKDTHDRLSAILYWQRKTGKVFSPTMDKLIRKMIDGYLNEHPDASEFIAR